MGHSVGSMPGEANGAQRAEGISLTGPATFDQELYGGDDRAGYVGSIGVADDADQDERERALARCAIVLFLCCARVQLALALVRPFRVAGAARQPRLWQLMCCCGPKPGRGMSAAEPCTVFEL